MTVRGSDASESPLPQRRGPVVASLALALICAVPIVPEVWAAWSGRGPTDLGRGGSLLMLAAFVVLPLWAARLFAGHRILVGDTDVTWVWRGRPRRTIRYDEVDRVVVGKELFRRPFRWNRDDVVVLQVTDGPDRKQIRASLISVRTLRPLLDRLVPVVAARPELLAPEHREAFDDLLARSPATP